MTDLCPTPSPSALEIARFERELAQAKSARDAQAVRDRYLGRKNSVVASWMQTDRPARPPTRRSEIGRYANELKQAIEARWERVHRARAQDRPPAGRRRRHAARPRARCSATGIR